MRGFNIVDVVMILLEHQVYFKTIKGRLQIHQSP
jgi:hypothetical protein